MMDGNVDFTTYFLRGGGSDGKLCPKLPKMQKATLAVLA